jgi:hypothetical protein
MHDSDFCPNAKGLDKSWPKIKFQQNKNTFTTHQVFLAVQTRRSSLNQPPTRTPGLQREIPVETDTSREISTQNETNTAENPLKFSTFRRRMYIPGTQQILTISTPNSPGSYRSHT